MVVELGKYQLSSLKSPLLHRILYNYDQLFAVDRQGRVYGRYYDQQNSLVNSNRMAVVVDYYFRLELTASRKKEKPICFRDYVIYLENYTYSMTEENLIAHIPKKVNATCFLMFMTNIFPRHMFFTQH